MRYMEFIKKILASKGIIIIIFVASMVRLLGVGSVPYGFANDEVSYIMSGYEIAKTGGYDIAGNFLPLSVNLDSSLSPVPVYIIALFVKLLGLSSIVARLPFALMGVGIVAIVYFLVKELFHNRKIAFLSALVLSFSSWHIVVTRTVWDVIPAQFFYLLGLYIFLKKVKKGSVLWSLPFFMLGFFSYHGTKVFFAFFIVLLLFLFGKQLYRRKKEFLFFVSGIFLIFLSFALVLKTQSVTRQEEIIFTNGSIQSDLKKTIEFDRAKSSAPHKLILLETNKITYYLQKMATNYLGAFSSQHLFTTGDIHPQVAYGIFFKGVLYLLDIPFIILGFAYLLEKSRLLTGSNKENSENGGISYKRGAILIIGGLLVSPLPSTVAAGYSYFIRSFMMAPFLSILIGIGLLIFYEFTRGRQIYKLLLRIFVIVFYGFFITRFFYQYNYQLNSYGSEYWNGSSRKLSEYIMQNESRFDKIIIANAEDKVILQFALVSKADPYGLQKAWKKNWPVKLGKVTFTNSCYRDDELGNVMTSRVFYAVPAGCHEKLLPQTTIADSLEPLRIIWKIYEN